MSANEIELPSNKNFGFFFTVVFYLTGIILGILYSLLLCIVFLTLGSLCLIITLTKPKLLQKFNYGWMKLGLVLGVIISPILLGIIYFVIIAPVGVLLRLIGRDELKLDLKKADSFWVQRPNCESSISDFHNQF